MRVMNALVFLLAVAIGTPVTASCIEQEIALSDVPEGVLAAAAGAVDRIVINEAERTGNGAAAVYELEGTAGGIEYEIRVSPSGEVLGIEQEDD
jgi:uncharacterized membrane protein YkoI